MAHPYAFARALLAIGIGFGALAYSGSARAETDTGFVLSASLGFGYSAGTYTLKGRSTDANGNPKKIEWRSQPSGMAIRAFAFLGYAIIRPMAIGIALDVNGVQAIGNEGKVMTSERLLTSYSIESVSMPATSLVAMFRPNDSEFRAHLGFGWATAAFGYSASGPLVKLNPPEPRFDVKSVSGPLGSIGFGYSPRSWGVALIASTGYLTSERATYLPLSCTLSATYSSF